MGDFLMRSYVCKSDEKINEKWKDPGFAPHSGSLFKKNYDIVLRIFFAKKLNFKLIAYIYKQAHVCREVADIGKWM
jgi:hypothetical protein